MKRNICVILLNLIFAMSALLLSSCGSSATIDLNNYLEIIPTGYDGYGSASYKIDYDRLYSEHVSSFGINKKSTEADIDTAKRLIRSCIEGTLDKSEKLSNGEAVTFTWEETDLATLEAKFDIKLKHSAYTQKISDLMTLEPFDPFEGLEVHFEGFSGQGTVHIGKYSVADDTLSYTPSKGSALTNGETITIEVSGSRGVDINDYEGVKGKRPTSTKKDYVVSKLNTYIQSIDEIDESSFSEIDQQIQDTFMSHVAKRWIDASTLKSFRFVGNYVLISKDLSIRAYPNNSVYFLYQYDATTPDLSEDFTGFYYGKLSDVYLDAENNLVYSLENIEYPTGNFRFGASGTIFVVGDYYYLGYSSYDDFVEKEITSNSDSYRYTDNVSIR